MICIRLDDGTRACGTHLPTGTISERHAAEQPAHVASLPMCPVCLSLAWAKSVRLMLDVVRGDWLGGHPEAKA